MIESDPPDELQRDDKSVITIGTFDGVHAGHRAIIDALVAKAIEIRGRSVVVTFDPHPQVVLRRKGDSVPLLTSAQERDELLGELGVDIVVVLEFTQQTAATSWEEFMENLLQKVGVAHIVFGHDHAFGSGRKGTAEALREMGRERGFDVTEVGPLIVDGEPVSSTKIRRAISEGNLPAAEHFLGRPYSVTGTVVRGDGRGRSLGIPTANVRPLEPSKLIPGNGVYCVAMIVDDKRLAGMANIGVRPTFTDGSERTLEVNLFDFDQDIYDQVVTVEFLRFIREERKFNDADEFLAQLDIDRTACRDE
ncbi:MAG: bifunctional riboflavin kinase/FAD synthetase [bacterium]|nr:bifunctional riboflavin kinase/FAD synthetase [Candidatus Kapabacteria bacterium]